MVVTSIPAAANALRVAPRTVAAWLAAGAPGERGRYDTEAIRAWRERSLRPATYDARRPQSPGPVDAVVDVATCFARDLVSAHGAFNKLLARLPRATREHLAVDLLFYLFCTVEEYSPIDKGALFGELGLADAFAAYHETHEKLGLNLDESEA